jgi:DHA1 family multidrug resistance protein-like MFS transporter
MIKLLRTPDRYIFAYALANMAQGGASILIPLYVSQVLNGSPSDFGIVTAVASFFGVIASLFWGRQSDRTGQRKPFVILGFFGVFVGLSLMGLSRSLYTLLWANVLLTFLWLASVAVSTSLAIHNQPRDQWSFQINRLNRMSTIGWMSGLILGTIWANWIVGLWGGTALSGLFEVLAVIALLAMICAILWIQEPKEVNLEQRVRDVLPTAGAFLERFRFMPLQLLHSIHPLRVWRVFRGENIFGTPLTRYFYAIIVYHLGFQAFFVPLPLFLLNQLGFGAAETFFLYIFHHGASALTNAYMSRFTSRYRTRNIQRFFLAVRSIMFALTAGLLFLKGNSVMLMIAVILMFIVTGLSWACINLSAISVISKRVRQAYRGQAIGAYYSAMGIGGIAGSLIGGFLATWSYPICFFFAAFCVIIGLLMTMRLPRGISNAKPLRPKLANAREGRL